MIEVNANGKDVFADLRKTSRRGNQNNVSGLQYSHRRQEIGSTVSCLMFQKAKKESEETVNT